jgi:ribonuclease P protein component
MVVVAGRAGQSRVAYVVSGKLCGAVRRNRIRRRLREAARRLIPCCQNHWDIVLIAKSGAEKADYHTLYGELAGLLQAASLLDSR